MGLGDGDVDVVVGGRDGALAYFERLANGNLQERTGNDNPFKDVMEETLAGSVFIAVVLDPQSRCLRLEITNSGKVNTSQT